VDVRPGHGIADHPEKEGRGLVAHQVGIQIQRGFRIFVGRGRKTRRYALQQQGEAIERSGECGLPKAGRGAASHSGRMFAMKCALMQY
jgi:hypothetical protein